MPKLVDHDVRRRELVDATWRVVHRGGVGQATVRAVAAEAGCSPGSLRHYFPAQAELIAFAMEVVSERVRERITALEPHGEVGAAVEQLLEQVLPLDDERRTEMEVWLAFSARAQADAALRAQRDEMHQALHAFVRGCVDALSEAGLLRGGLTPELEVDRLHALIDGLALHGIADPVTMSPDRTREVLRCHLASLSRA